MFKTTKAKVIFVVALCVICISVTFGLIMYKNIEIETDFSDEEETVINEANKKDTAGINIKGTYNQNNLHISDNTVTKEKVEIIYCQIDGLKNKTIEDNINKDLEISALNLYKEKIKDLNEVINVSVDMWNSANFSDVLSFNISYVAKIDDNGDGFYQGFKGLNYNLKTGETITIDKLFTSDAPIEEILRKSAYYSLIQNNLEENLSGNLIVSDYGDIEDEVASFIKQYKEGKITEFYFTPRYICIYYGENSNINIDMMEYADYIAIYSRYLTSENIYESNDIGLKNLYTLSTRDVVDYRYTNYAKGSNYFIDINMDNNDGEQNEFSKKLIQNKIKKIEAEIDKMKTIANQNPDKFYILNYYIQIYTTKEDSTNQTLTNCFEKGNSYEMTIHDFEENIEPIIMQYNREDMVALPDYLYDFSKELKVELQENIEYYNPTTGEKIVI